MLADREAIAGVIPHAGDMCLLDGVLECNERRIRCVTNTHRESANPLRVGGELPSLCGIEYAAQAMAVHGVMGGQIGHRPRAGYLAGLRDVQCAAMRLDDLPGELIVEAEKLMGYEANVIYLFELHAGGRRIVSGRATVVLDTKSGDA